MVKKFAKQNMMLINRLNGSVKTPKRFRLMSLGKIIKTAKRERFKILDDTYHPIGR